MEEFIQRNSSAIFGLLGVFGGGAISFVTAWLLRKRDYNLRLWDKLLDRRIKAHENVITLAIEMRVIVAVGGVEDNGEVARAPQMLVSKDEFENWFIRFTQLTQGGSTWLSTETKREFNLVQDYLVTLHQYLVGVSSDDYLEIGRIIRHDFIHLSSELEKRAFNFFEHDVHQLKLNKLNEWHKYQRDETEKRLHGTVLLQKWDKVQAYRKSKINEDESLT